MHKTDPVQVMKRDGSTVLFNKQKITIAICKAMSSVHELDLNLAETITDDVIASVAKKFSRKIPSVESIQDVVEEHLVRHGLTKTAKAYIIYRQQRSELREARRAVLHGMEDDSNLSLNALKTLEQRYLLRDAEGQLIETPTEMFVRVATCAADPERLYAGDIQDAFGRFHRLLSKGYFLPNSPTLMYAGIAQGHLLAQHALPLNDSIHDIFETLRKAALIHHAGGGTGFSFSHLRPKGALVQGKGFVALGPVRVMQLYDAGLTAVVQGGRRSGANMGVLRVDHPDIMEFINVKSVDKTMPNFNLSVGITDVFMRAVKDGTDYPILDPRTNQVIGRAPARVVFNNIVNMAWRRGDPGLLFLDRINADNTVPALGSLETTSPCAEMPLLPYEACAQGSINLVKMIDDDGIFNWDRLKSVVHDSVHFLDNLLDATHYPLKEVREATLKTRKIGLGVLGFADLLYRLGISYNSKEGLIWADKIMGFIHAEARARSRMLAESRGVFPAWKNSIYAERQLPLRNATLTAISPTGTRSMILDVSAGMEPNFSLCFIKTVMGGKEFVYVNEPFKEIALKKGFYSETLMRKIASQGGLDDIEEVPADVKAVFVTTQQISAEWHIRMQAAFQKHVDGAISKTINFPSSATVLDVEQGYVLAHELGCKGITIYRDGSLDAQVIKVRY